MINNIYSHTPLVKVGVGNGSTPYISSCMADMDPMVGSVRFIENEFEVYTGAGWVKLIGNFIELTTPPDVRHAIDWAIQKMYEEEDLKALMREYPAVKSAKEFLDITIALTKNHSEG